MSGADSRAPVAGIEDVIHYAGSSKCDNGKVDGLGLLARPSDNGEASVNRLKGLADNDTDAVAVIRSLCRLAIRPNGLWAQFNVGVAINRLQSMADIKDARCLSAPLPQEATYPADPTHAVICPLPHDDGSEFADLVGDILKNAVTAHYPGR